MGRGRTRGSVVLLFGAWALLIAAAWLAVDNPNVDAPLRHSSGSFSVRRLAPYDVVLNDAGNALGGELGIDYRRGEQLCRNASQHRFALAVILGLAGSVISAAAARVRVRRTVADA